MVVVRAVNFVMVSNPDWIPWFHDTVCRRLYYSGHSHGDHFLTKGVYVVLVVSWESFCHFLTALKLPVPLIYIVCDLMSGFGGWVIITFCGSISVRHGAFKGIRGVISVGHGYCLDV